MAKLLLGLEFQTIGGAKVWRTSLPFLRFPILTFLEFFPGRRRRKEAMGGPILKLEALRRAGTLGKCLRQIEGKEEWGSKGQDLCGPESH